MPERDSFLARLHPEGADVIGERGVARQGLGATSLQDELSMGAELRAAARVEEGVSTVDDGGVHADAVPGAGVAVPRGIIGEEYLVGEIKALRGRSRRMYAGAHSSPGHHAHDGGDGHYEADAGHAKTAVQGAGQGSKGISFCTRRCGGGGQSGLGYVFVRNVGHFFKQDLAFHGTYPLSVR